MIDVLKVSVPMRSRIARRKRRGVGMKGTGRSIVVRVVGRPRVSVRMV